MSSYVTADVDGFGIARSGSDYCRQRLRKLSGIWRSSSIGNYIGYGRVSAEFRGELFFYSNEVTGWDPSCKRFLRQKSVAIVRFVHSYRQASRNDVSPYQGQFTFRLESRFISMRGIVATMRAIAQNKFDISSYRGADCHQNSIYSLSSSKENH
jgi:hypothetical protein